ncbi:hypothetical protein ACLH09_05565 [Citrobacter braakii]|uniref:hypothetical protein n=1 Tax=Citrobacter braakii TaxID=57706 RepID=UPI0039840089
MEQNEKYISKTEDCIETFADSTLTIPVKMGNEIFCTINFIKHKMDLQQSDDGQFNSAVRLTKEIVSSITLTEAHAIELSNIIKAQIDGLKKQSEVE